MFLMRAFFQTLPDELIEAARVDGGSEFTIFRRVILPLTRPGIATVVIFQFLLDLERVPDRQHGPAQHRLAAAPARAVHPDGPVLHQLAGPHRRPHPVRRPGRHRLRPDAAAVRRRDDARRGQELHSNERGPMPIKNVVVNCTDVQRSVEYYTKFLELRVVGEPTPERAVLDAVTATIEFRAVGNGRDQSTWVRDDLQKGFRHIGFKVDRLDERADVLKAAGVEFKLDPLDAEGEVRICFFYDPDGTLLEMIQGDLQYAAVLDAGRGRAGAGARRTAAAAVRPRRGHDRGPGHDQRRTTTSTSASPSSARSSSRTTPAASASATSSAATRCSRCSPTRWRRRPASRSSTSPASRTPNSPVTRRRT